MRYILWCPMCGLLFAAQRRDALTCGVRCRVALHRCPTALDPLRTNARTFDVDVADILEASALQRLRPDLADLLAAGTMTLADCRPAMRAALLALVEREPGMPASTATPTP